jgi:hypothetical protein
VRVETDHRALSRNDISMAVPPRWDGRILFRDAAGSQGAIFQVANFELPANEGFEPPQELLPGEEDPIKAMDAGDVLVTVVSDHSGGGPAPATITHDDLRSLPAGAPRVPHGHTLAARSFCYGARCVQIEVDFGGPAEPALVSGVDEVLASLEVEQRSTNTTSADEGRRPPGAPPLFKRQREIRGPAHAAPSTLYDLTSIRRRCARSDLGTRTVRTPSARLASICSGSTCAGRLTR